jgi:hypothetical protein
VTRHSEHGCEAAVPLAAVAAAWRAVGGGQTVRVEPVRLRNKSAIYRLTERSRGGETIVAKRAGAEVLRNEWTIYDRLLPLLPLTRACAYGFLEDGASAWLFLEDAGDRVCDPNAACALTAQWLATLHGAASTLELTGLLPDRGTSRYREQMRAARRAICQHFGDEALSSADRRSLASLVSITDAIDERWDVVEEICATGPVTLAHGDFVTRNLRLRTRADGTEALIVLDWECAGTATSRPTRAAQRRALPNAG